MMFKKLMLSGCLLIAGLGVFAQDRMPQRVYTYSDAGASGGFNKENLFLGGSLALGIGSYQFNVGVSPEIARCIAQIRSIETGNTHSRRAKLEEIGDITAHLRRGGGGQGNRDRRTQHGADFCQSHVVGTKIMAPEADAVGLIYDK